MDCRDAVILRLFGTARKLHAARSGGSASFVTSGSSGGLYTIGGTSGTSGTSGSDNESGGVVCMFVTILQELARDRTITMNAIDRYCLPINQPINQSLHKHTQPRTVAFNRITQLAVIRILNI